MRLKNSMNYIWFKNEQWEKLNKEIEGKGKKHGIKNTDKKKKKKGKKKIKQKETKKQKRQKQNKIEINEKEKNREIKKDKSRNLRSFLLRCGAGTNEWGTHWDLSSLLKIC